MHLTNNPILSWAGPECAVVLVQALLHAMDQLGTREQQRSKKHIYIPTLSYHGPQSVLAWNKSISVLWLAWIQVGPCWGWAKGIEYDRAAATDSHLSPQHALGWLQSLPWSSSGPSPPLTWHMPGAANHSCWRCRPLSFSCSCWSATAKMQVLLAWGLDRIGPLASKSW